MKLATRYGLVSCLKTFALLFPNDSWSDSEASLAISDCVEVDALILEIADYKNDYADVAAERIMRKCATSWEALQYLQERACEAWIPGCTISGCLLPYPQTRRELCFIRPNLSTANRG